MYVLSNHLGRRPTHYHELTPDDDWSRHARPVTSRTPHLADKASLMIHDPRVTAWWTQKGHVYI